MRVHVLQHVPFEDVGSMSGWLEARRARLTCTRFFEDPVLPPLEGIDLMIAMGGPMSLNDEDALPWLRPEKALIRQAVERGLAVVGICLGAQLIASALGARVYPNARKEIGWFPVHAVPGPAGVFSFPETCRVFHWHGETFTLPAGAVHLARSTACENQAFQIGPRAVGLQFHLETTPESARSLLAHCRNELSPGPFVQTETEMLAVTEETYRSVNHLMDRLLDYVTRPRH